MSFTLAVELLTERYAARAGTSDAAEWPPHPARLYYALVASWAAEVPRSSQEQAALEWLAEQGSPELACSVEHHRRPVTHYVPVNDVRAVNAHDKTYARMRAEEAALVASAGDARAEARAGKRLEKARAKAVVDSERLSRSLTATVDALGVLPERRVRQARTFPTVLPVEPRFALSWPHATPTPAHRDALDALAARVSRLGHPSSLVSCRVTAVAPPPTHVPSPDGPIVLRCAAPGILALLDAAYDQHQGREPRILPADWVDYEFSGEPRAEPPPTGVFGEDWVVLAIAAGPRLPLAATLPLTRGVRDALMRHAGSPAPEILSGLVPGAGGGAATPSQRPHLVIAPLPFVGSTHASGAILGVALILPRQTDPGERRSVLRALVAWGGERAELDLALPAGHLRLEAREDPTALSLQADTWCRPSSTWASATPVALDRTPRHLFRGSPAQRAAAEEEAADVIRRSCFHVGLPAPAVVRVRHDGPLVGVPGRQRFAPFTTAGGRVRRASVHAVLEFARPVLGPVVIGAGRYLGYGLFRPLSISSGSQ